MPFSVTPDPNFLFLSQTHMDALEHLRYGINQRKGFIMMVGEVGCGKTTICKKLLEELHKDQYQTALILNPRLTEDQLFKSILLDLGVKSQPHSNADLLKLLNDHLLDLIGQGKEIVLICDEAQNMSFETIESLRLLSNLETDTRKLLQIILIGQPELKEKIKQKRLRQLAQRILVFYELDALSLPETRRYIQHRLTLAGSSGVPFITDRAIRAVHRKTNGTPRLINNLCDKMLLSAYTKNRFKVTWWDFLRGMKEMRIS